MQTECDFCHKQYNVPEKNAGKKAKCSCGETFTITNVLEKILNNTASVGEKIANNTEVTASTKNYTKTADNNLQPYYYSFMLKMILCFFMIILAFLIILIIFSGEMGDILLVFLGILVFVLLPVYIFRHIQYKKEKYTLTDRKIIYNSGTIFSDNSVEIGLDRIVQVKSTLGFIQNKIFKTGVLEIKTAGSSNSTVSLKHIKLPMEVYEEIQMRMKKNGFQLEMNKLVQEEKPHFLGIIGEVFGKFIGVIFVIAYLAFTLYSEIQGEDLSDFGDDFSNISDSTSSLSSTIITGSIWIISSLFGIIILLTFVCKYLDLRKRRYQIFTDTIVYNEGFLSKHYSFIPMENISDTENTQSFFSKVFGLHDIVVSSAGNNNKVIFKNMVNGEKMMENIKYLKNATILKEKESIEGEEEKTSLIGFKNTMESALKFDTSFQDTYRMHMGKTLLPLLFLLIFPPVGIVAIIAAIIQIKFTDFIIGESSIEKKYGFINTKHNSFSVEKITGIVITESLIDKLFKTCSIKFWSIGNGSDITFRNIKKTPDLEKNIREKVGIYTDEVQKNIVSQLTFLDYIKSKIGVFIFIISAYILLMLAVVVINTTVGSGILGGNISLLYTVISAVFGLILFFIFLRVLYAKFYYAPVRYINNLYPDCIESIQGFFIVTKKYALLRNIKGTKTTKYPLTETGNITFDIAGEQIHTQQGNKNGLIIIFKLLTGKKTGSTSIVSNKISMYFIQDVFSIFEDIDEYTNKKTLDTTSLLTSTQDIGNSIIAPVISSLIFGIFIFYALTSSLKQAEIMGTFISGGIIFLSIIIIGFKIWTIKVKKYDYQQDRILFHSGIIYKSKHSILYKKFNYVEKSQGFLNKIFKNGNIDIFTLGSGSIDMKIKDIDNFNEVNELFKK